MKKYQARNFTRRYKVWAGPKPWVTYTCQKMLLSYRDSNRLYPFPCYLLANEHYKLAVNGNVTQDCNTWGTFRVPLVRISKWNKAPWLYNQRNFTGSLAMHKKIPLNIKFAFKPTCIWSWNIYLKSKWFQCSWNINHPEEKVYISSILPFHRFFSLWYSTADIILSLKFYISAAAWTGKNLQRKLIHAKILGPA